MTWTPLSTGGSTDFAFKTYVTPPRFTKGNARRSGWRRFADPSFKNQGQCIKFVNHQGKAGKQKGNDDKGKGKKGKGNGGKKKSIGRLDLEDHLRPCLAAHSMNRCCPVPAD